MAMAGLRRQPQQHTLCSVHTQRQARSCTYAAGVQHGWQKLHLAVAGEAQLRRAHAAAWDEASGVLHIDCTHLVLSWSPRAPLATRLLPSDCQKLLSPDWNRRCFATDPVSGVTYVGCPGLRHLYAYAPGSASNSSSIVIPGDTGYAVAWPVVRPAQRQLYIVGFGAWIEDMRFSVAQYVLQLDEAGLAPVQGGLLANVSLSSAGWLLLYQVMVLVQADGSWIISLLLSDLPRRLLARASGRRYLHG